MTTPTRDEIRKAKVTLWRWGIFLAAALIIGGTFAYGAIFSPANKPGADTAFNACEMAMIRDDPNAVLPASPGDVNYSGSVAQWTITGTYHLLGMANDGLRPGARRCTPMPTPRWARPWPCSSPCWPSPCWPSPRAP